MEDEVTMVHEGTTYSANFLVHDDSVTVFLPNGEQRTTVLRGIEPETAARPHLRSYVLGLVKAQRKS